MNTAGRPWWQQVTALVSVSTGGAITGFSFVPHAVADIKAPANVPVHLLALEKEAQRPTASDSLLRSAIVNVTKYFLRMARTKSPAEMQAIIWQHDSIDGADHGASCAAFASLTLELAAQVVGQHSWVTGGTSYPWPLHKWADVRVDPNPDSPGITSVLQDAQAHHRWHPLDSGYQPLPGDWVLFDGHIEVITSYQHGVLQTVGGDSLPDFSVNAHEYHDPLAAQGVVGFVNNGAPHSGQAMDTPAGRQSSSRHDAAPAAQPASAPPVSAEPSNSGSASAAPDVPGVPPPSALASQARASAPSAPAPSAPAPSAPAPSAPPPSAPPPSATATATPEAPAAAIPGIVAPLPAGAATAPAAPSRPRHAPPRPRQAQEPPTSGPAATGPAPSGPPPSGPPPSGPPPSGPAPSSPAVPGQAGPGSAGPGSAGPGSAVPRHPRSAHSEPSPAPPAAATALAAVPGSDPGTPTGPPSAGEPAIPGSQPVAPGASAAAAPARGPRAGHPAGAVTAAGSAAHAAGPVSADVPGAAFTDAGLPAVATGGAAIPGLLTAASALAGPTATAGDGSSAHAPASHTAPAAGQYVRHEPALPGSHFHGTAAQEAFIRSVAPGAIVAQQRYGVPASVTIAQAIDESGWGLSSLAARDHNLFGIKGAGPAGSDPLPTQEYVNGQWITVISPFRVYRNAAQSIEDHGKLLATSGYYQRAMADRHNPNAFAAALTGVYATDPGYGAKIISIMQRYDLYRYDAPATAPARPTAAAPPAPASPSPASPSPASLSPASPSPASPSPASPSPAPTSPLPASPAPTSSAPASPGPSPGLSTVTPSRLPSGGARSPASSGISLSPSAPSAAPASSSARGTRAPSAFPASGGPASATADIPGMLAPPASAASAPPVHAGPARTQRAGTAVPTADAATGHRPNSPVSAHRAAPSPQTVAGPLPGGAPAQRRPAGTAAAQGRRTRATGARAAGGATDVTRQPAASAAAAGGQGAPSGDHGVTRGSAPEVQTLAAVRLTAPASRAAAASSIWAPSRQPGVRTVRYRPQLPPTVRTAFTAMARVPLLREEPLYREISSRTGVRWELLAACDWMQCEAHPRHSPVRGEKLGTRNPDGTIYRTRSEALEQCAADLVNLPRAVYGIEVATCHGLSVEELAHVFAAFRWGGLLKAHHTSAMEFPYSVAGLNPQRLKMRWPNIDDPDAPDKPGTRFRMPFGAVPVVLCLNYPATV